jgi:ATP-dependent DNA helicase RecG
VTLEVTPEVRLLRALTKPMSRRELQLALGLKHHEHFRKTNLLPALDQGLVDMTIPDRPDGRMQ